MSYRIAVPLILIWFGIVVLVPATPNQKDFALILGVVAFAVATFPRRNSP